MGLDHYDWELGDVLVVHLTGPITLGDGTQKFRKLIHETAEAGRKKIVLNMAEVYYVDSSGLGELVAAYTTINRHGGTLKLCKLTSRVRDLVHLTKVYRIFEVFDTEEAAAKSFQAVV